MRYIPFDLPPEMLALIGELRAASSKEEALKHAYNILSVRYRGERLKTYTQFWRLFTRDVHVLWATTGFMHCTNLNYLLRILLIKSGWFTENDIKRKWSLIWFISPHQYLRIRVADTNYVNVDIWAAAFGIIYGDYAHGFH